MARAKPHKVTQARRTDLGLPQEKPRALRALRTIQAPGGRASGPPTCGPQGGGRQRT
jgi:hypothetical protein